MLHRKQCEHDVAVETCCFHDDITRGFFHDHTCVQFGASADEHALRKAADRRRSQMSDDIFSLSSLEVQAVTPE